MTSSWVMVIVFTINGQSPQKGFMIDGHAYASRGLCEMAGITKVGDATSSCEEVPIRLVK